MPWKSEHTGYNWIYRYAKPNLLDNHPTISLYYLFMASSNPTVTWPCDTWTWGSEWLDFNKTIIVAAYMLYLGQDRSQYLCLGYRFCLWNPHGNAFLHWFCHHFCWWMHWRSSMFVVVFILTVLGWPHAVAWKSVFSSMIFFTKPLSLEVYHYHFQSHLPYQVAYFTMSLSPALVTWWAAK